MRCQRGELVRGYFVQKVPNEDCLSLVLSNEEGMSPLEPMRTAPMLLCR